MGKQNILLPLWVSRIKLA